MTDAARRAISALSDAVTALSDAVTALSDAVTALAEALAKAPTPEDLAAARDAADKQARIVGQCITLLEDAERMKANVRTEDLRAVLDACRINPK